MSKEKLFYSSKTNKYSTYLILFILDTSAVSIKTKRKKIKKFT